MPDNAVTPVLIERASEQLRQEREIFDQRKLHEARWFYLRLVMGYSSVVLLTAVMLIASYILINSSQFGTAVVTSAGGALFVDVLGLLVGVWKIALNPTFITKLTPETYVNLPDIQDVMRATDEEATPTSVQG
jgi:hypothetical protein